MYNTVLFIPNTVLGSLQHTHPMDFVGPQHFPHVFYVNTQHRDTCGTGSSKATVRSSPWTAWALFRRRGFERGKHQLSSVWWLGRQTTAISEYVEMRAFIGITSFSTTKSQSDGNHFMHFFSKSSTDITGSF